MKYLLDTDTCIHLIRAKSAKTLRKLTACEVGDVGISSISVAELQYGVAKSQDQERNQQVLEQFLIPLVIADFDHRAALEYGTIRTTLEARGTPIGAMDLLIAAHAVSLGVTLVTCNKKEIARVPRLTVADWTN